MFTGIVKGLGKIKEVSQNGTNQTFHIEAAFEEPIQVDQSIAHDGVCLTVEDISQQTDQQAQYQVTAVQETLEKTNLGTWKVGHEVNLELCMRMGDRLDGHFVQGHVDTTGMVKKVETRAGSWMYAISFPPTFSHLLVDKGSVTVNGVSLTVVHAGADFFSITIIPFTFEHTNFKHLREGDTVNLEFDVLGKYIDRLNRLRTEA